MVKVLANSPLGRLLDVIDDERISQLERISDVLRKGRTITLVDKRNGLQIGETVSFHYPTNPAIKIVCHSTPDTYNIKADHIWAVIWDDSGHTVAEISVDCDSPNICPGQYFMIRISFIQNGSGYEVVHARAGNIETA